MRSTQPAISRPADSSSSSFLDLPAELRNYVYESYIMRLDTLRLQDFGNGKIVLVNDDRQGSGLRRDVPDLHILRTCRQVHQEAASILYSAIFHLSKEPRGLTRKHDSTGHYVNHSCAAWLRQIGQHKIFVRKLVIDLNSTCPPSCVDTEQARLQTFRPNDGFYQFGALLQSIWASDLEMIVSFVKPLRMDGGRCSSRNHTTPKTAHSASACNVQRLTETFQALAKDDLDIKRFRRAIGDIGIKADGSCGVFALWTSAWQDKNNHAYATIDHDRNPLLDHARYFTVETDGKLAFSRVTSAGLLGLPKGVLEKIVEHSVGQDTPRELDLDSFTNLQDLYGIVYTSMDLHDRHLSHYLHKDTFKLSLMCSNSRASFDFGKLDRLLRTELMHHVENTTHGHQFGAWVMCFVDLHVHFGTLNLVSSFKNIRINVMPLVASTLAASRHQIWRVYLHNGISILEGQVSSIRKLRHEVIAILSKYVKKDHYDDVHVRCPEIWMDGNGKVIDIVPTGSVDGESVQNPAKSNSVLWSAEKTGSYVGAKAPVVPTVDGRARDMYLYLKWIHA